MRALTGRDSPCYTIMIKDNFIHSGLLAANKKDDDYALLLFMIMTVKDLPFLQTYSNPLFNNQKEDDDKEGKEILDVFK